MVVSSIIDRPEAREQLWPLSVEAYHALGEAGLIPERTELLYGDFNEDKAEASIVEIEGVSGMELSMHRINVKDSRGEAWTHYWEFQDLYSRFDYFFVSRPLEPYVDKRHSCIYDVPSFYSGSDHRPIVMKIDLVKNARR